MTTEEELEVLERFVGYCLLRNASLESMNGETDDIFRKLRHEIIVKIKVDVLDFHRLYNMIYEGRLK